MFKGTEQEIIDVANANGVDGTLLTALLLVETKNGTRTDYKRSYNIDQKTIFYADKDGELYEEVIYYPSFVAGLNAYAKDLFENVIVRGYSTVDSLYENIYERQSLSGLNQKDWLDSVNKSIKLMGGLVMDCTTPNLDFVDNPELNIHLGGKFTIPTQNTFRVTSHYGYRIHPIYLTKKLHTGIDLACTSNLPIVSVKEGKVIYAENKGISGGWSTTYGNYIIVNHGGYNTLYAHLNASLVTVGQSVAEGELIGLCGSTGASTGNHLHFEVRINGSTVNPYPYLVGQ